MTDSADHTAPPRLVIVVDLRTEFESVLAARRFADIQAAYARTRVPAGTRHVDADRVLVIDAVEDLIAHREAYELIFAGMYSKVVCVAVGAPAAGSVVLRRPGQLAGSDAATLWVGDVRGTEWAPGRAPGITLAPDDSDALASLLDVLTQPEVFDQVLDAVTEMPRSVASPGMSVFVHRIRDDAVQRARIRAAQRLAGTDAGVDEPWPEPLASLAEGRGAALAPAGPGSQDCVRPDGRLGGMGGLAGQGFTRARERVALFASPLALYGSAGRAGRPIGAEIADAANVLRDYRDLIRQTVGRGAGGFDADGRAWLDHVGVVVPEAPGLGTTSVASALYERTSAAFERPEGLVGFAERLRELADRIKPAPGSGRVDEVDRTCSDAVLARYVRPAAFPIGPGHPGVVAGFALGGFLTAFWPAFGLLGAVLAVLLATAAAALIAIRRPDREGRSALPPEVLSTIMVNGLAAAVGAAGGWFAGDAWGPPIGVGPLALVLGLGILAVLPGVDWMLRARTWEQALVLGGALHTLNALHGVLVRTVWNDWALAGPRRDAVDRSTVLAALLEESARILADDASAIEKQFAGELSASAEPAPSPAAFAPGAHPVAGRPAPPSSPPPGAGGGLSDTVSGDLVDALHAAFEPLWVMLERDPAEASRRGAKAELEPVLRSYGDHLAHNGIQAAPPFARRRQDRPHVGDAVGSDADRIAELLAQTPDRPMLQLCGPDQLILLDHVVASARNVGFAPRGVRPAVREALRDRRAGYVVDGEPVWTSGGRMAGVLRLLPLLPGTVDDARIWEESGAERADLGGRGGGREGGREGERDDGFGGGFGRPPGDFEGGVEGGGRAS